MAALYTRMANRDKLAREAAAKMLAAQDTNETARTLTNRARTHGKR